MNVIKTIKFDLPIDGVKVKTLVELQQHFTTEILDLYKNGLLARWLQAQGLNDQLSAVNSLSLLNNDALLLNSLCEVFNVVIDDIELITQLANYHVSGIKIDPDQLSYKAKYEALTQQAKPQGKIMGFDGEFVGPEIDINMLERMHKHHTGEDIILVPVHISKAETTYDLKDEDVQNQTNYRQAVGSVVSYGETVFKFCVQKNAHADKQEAFACAPCDGILYKKVRVTSNSLIAFYYNANGNGMLANLDPIVVAYLRVDC
jgi:hypothetical protein